MLARQTWATGCVCSYFGSRKYIREGFGEIAEESEDSARPVFIKKLK